MPDKKTCPGLTANVKHEKAVENPQTPNLAFSS